MVVAVSVVVCPLSLGEWGLRQGAFAEEGGRQQPFTFVPSLSILEVTRTVEGPALGAVTSVPTLGPGQYFEEDDPNRPNPEADLVAVTGDDHFGYGRIWGSPDLYLVWVTDERGTHYLVVGADDPLLMGGRDDDFSDFIGQRDEQVDAIETARGWAIGSSATMMGMGTILVVCGVTALAGCLPAPIAGGVAFGGATTWTWIRSHWEHDLERLERNLQGQFWDMVIASPPP